jgi:hypothetical protein
MPIDLPRYAAMYAATIPIGFQWNATFMDTSFLWQNMAKPFLAFSTG